MIVITGATGHLGNVLVRKLVSRNRKIRVMVLPGEDIASLEGLEVEKVEGDVCFPDSITVPESFPLFPDNKSNYFRLML